MRNSKSVSKKSPAPVVIPAVVNSAYAKGAAVNAIIAAPAPVIVETSSNRISEGVRESWKDPVVRAKRQTRNAVLVRGVTYSSAWQAWLALGLPESKCIKFRIALKQEKRKNFEFAGKKYDFQIVE